MPTKVHLVKAMVFPVVMYGCKSWTIKLSAEELILLNVLSRLDITFLPRSDCLLISWMQSPSTVILEPQKIKTLTLFPLFPHLFPMQ